MAATMPSPGGSVLSAQRSPRGAAMRTTDITHAPGYKVYVKGVPASKTLLDCPFCHRVLLTLEVKSIPYSVDYIDFADKPAWLQQRSGGKVPVINKGDFWMPDSDEIVKLLEAEYPEPSMISSVPAEVSANFFPLFKGWLFAEPEELEQKMAAFLEVMSKVNNYLAANEGPFFGGDHLDSTDAALAPKLYHAIVGLGQYRGLSMNAYPAVTTYMEKVQQLPAWKKVDYGAAAIIKSWSHKH